MRDGINSQDFSLQYIKVDQVIRMVSCYGPSALMAKFEVESAYQNIPVHPDDCFLLGMRWRGQFYVDLLLPFGFRSEPFIFNSMAVWLNGSFSISTTLPICYSIWMTLLLQVPHSRPSVLITLTRQSLFAIAWGCLFTLTNVWAQPLPWLS